MIQNLIQNLITLLRDGFAGEIAEPENHITAGPVAEPAAGALPVIALYADKLEINQNVKESSSSQPRPQEFREEIVVSTATPAGPYNLAKTPLLKSTLCKIIFDKDEVSERRILLVEGKDFTIDYSKAEIVFSSDLSQASHILLKYSFVGVFTIREFQQHFLVDIYDDDRAEVEEVASLATCMILTNHDELIEAYNFKNKTEYSTNQTNHHFTTSHIISQLHILEGAPGNSDSIFKLQLKFKAVGQLKLTKEITDGFGLIEKIHSPGRTSAEPVDIEIGVE